MFHVLQVRQKRLDPWEETEKKRFGGEVLKELHLLPSRRCCSSIKSLAGQSFSLQPPLFFLPYFSFWLSCFRFLLFLSTSILLNIDNFIFRRESQRCLGSSVFVPDRGLWSRQSASTCDLLPRSPAGVQHPAKYGKYSAPKKN